MIYEVNCALCGNVFYKILFDDDGKYEVSCPNCGATYPHLTFKTIKPNEVPNVDTPHETLKNKVKEIIARGKINFCPVHLIPTTANKCPICGRKAHVLEFDPSQIPDSLLNLVINTVDEDITAVLDTILHILIEYDIPKRLIP